MIVYNEGQARTVRDGINWYKYSSEQVFEVDGEAGTGKSVVLFGIIKELGLKPYEILPMAYTGQAAIVMRTKGFTNAKSIHSGLYISDKELVPYKDSPFKVNTQFNTPEYYFKFRPLNKGELDPNIKLMVIDEGWMVPDNMVRDIKKHGIKILVAGDSGQLPPIGGNPAFLTGYNVHHLTELMRQSVDNPIIYLAHRARRGEPIHCGLYGNRVLVIDENDLTNEMVLDVGNIICGTNKTRDMFNNTIRKLRGYESPLPYMGERIICRNNNWNVSIDNIALANGLAGVVTTPFNLSNFANGIYKLDFLPDLLNRPFENIGINYEYLVSPYDVRNQIKAERMNKRYDTGELFEYANAITTHLSQGAEYYSGIYYEEFLRTNIQNQLNYTGITRFRDYMIYVKKTKKYY